MEFSIIPDEEALSKCAWCLSNISDHMEVFGFGAKLKSDVDRQVSGGKQDPERITAAIRAILNRGAIPVALGTDEGGIALKGSIAA